jgi:hypothetical protein
VLQEIDFWNDCGDIAEEWLNDDEYVVSLQDYKGNLEFLTELKVDPKLVDMLEIYIVIPIETQDVFLSVLCKDKNGNALEDEIEYSLSQTDKDYMLNCLAESNVLERMKYEFEEGKKYIADNDYIGR